ncbi:uncharacterized protein LOC111801981 [Cucurbita pepo subsp. pepo]|uniref:uncharacterized protein LOC111801981 n=1 Tax=Cucurbita pepo subsp. pepo TaxID=3664 RepID=UPI000C9D9F5E|nr:uncharacterized protein LOC111801981 [Cucurbita pepo subsp. pepo]
MPFELFPSSRTDRGKRKRERGEHADYDAAAAAGNQKETVAERGNEREMTSDEEVEEFFAILKRLHAATKYIEKIDGARSLLMGKRAKTAKASEKEGDGVEIRTKRIPDQKLDRNLDLDLNLEPTCVESDGKERRSRSHNLKSLTGDSAADSRRK